MSTKPKCLRSELHCTQGEVVGHLGRVSAKLFLENVQGPRDKGLETLVEGEAESRINQLFFPLLETSLECVGIDDYAHPSLGIAEGCGQLPLTDGRIGDDDVYHRVVRIADFCGTTTRWAGEGRVIGLESASNLRGAGGGGCLDGFRVHGGSI